MKTVDLGSGPEATLEHFSIDLEASIKPRRLTNLRGSCGCIRNLAAPQGEIIPANTPLHLTFDLETAGHVGEIKNSIAASIEQDGSSEILQVGFVRRVLSCLSLARYIALNEMPRDGEGRYIVAFDSDVDVSLPSGDPLLRPDLIKGALSHYTLRFDPDTVRSIPQIRTVHLQVGHTLVPLTVALAPKHAYFVSSEINAGYVTQDMPVTVRCALRSRPGLNLKDVRSNDPQINVVKFSMPAAVEPPEIEVTFVAKSPGLAVATLDINFEDRGSQLQISISLITIAEAANSNISIK